MGGITTIIPQPHALMFGLRHVPALLTVPWPIPVERLAPPVSQFPPNPLDSGGVGKEEFQYWDMAEASDWIEGSGESL